MSKPKIPITIDGVEYPSIRAYAKACGVPYSTLRARLRKGSRSRASRYEIMVAGVAYPSIKAYAEANGVPYGALASRVRDGMSIEDAASELRSNAMRQEITVDGVAYPSIQACAEACCVPYSALKYRINKGQPIKDAISELRSDGGVRTRNTPVTVNGKTYHSIKECAADLGLPYGLLSDHLRQGEPIEAAIRRIQTHKRGKKVTIDGMAYSSLKECARAFGISYTMLRNRLKDGMSIKDAVMGLVADGQGPILIEHAGRTYESMAELARAHGISPALLHARLKEGRSLDEALVPSGAIIPARNKPIEAFGVKYRSAREFARIHGMTHTTITDRLRNGIDPEDMVRHKRFHTMRLASGEKVKVPFAASPRFAFANDAGVNWYYAQCPACGAVLILPEDGLMTFKHNDIACRENRLPAYARVRNYRLQNWINAYYADKNTDND